LENGVSAKNHRWLLVATVLGVVAPVTLALAEPLVVLTREAPADSNRLLFVDTNDPRVIDCALNVSGLPAGSVLAAIDTRIATGELYGYAVPAATGITSLTLYRISLNTGVATVVGTPVAVLSAGSSNMDMAFDPATDSIFVATGADARYWSANPDVGGVSPPLDQVLQYAPGQGSGTPYLNGLAYDRSSAGATLRTLYAVERNQQQFVRVGGIDGVPSASLGAVFVIGPLNAQIGGNAFSPGNQVGFDISPSGLAVASLTGKQSNTAVAFLFSINLATGAATLLGNGPIGITAGVIDVAFVGNSTAYCAVFASGFES
jgi:hypothetical protein